MTVPKDYFEFSTENETIRHILFPNTRELPPSLNERADPRVRQ